MTAAVIAEVGFRINSNEINQMSQRIRNANGELEDLEDNLEDAEKASDDLNKAVGEVTSAIKVGFAAAAAATAALTAAYIITTNKTRDLARESNKLGVGVEALQELQFAAGSLGLELDALNDALTDTAELTSEAMAVGTGAASEAIAELGINIQSLRGQSADQLFNTYADALSGVADEGDQVRLAILLFGDAGKELLPILKQGSAGIDEYRKKAKELGIVLSQEQVAASNKAGESTRALTSQFAALSDKLIVGVAPAIEDVAERFGELTVNEEKLASVTETLSGIITGFADGVIYVYDNLELMVNALKGLLILKVAGFVGNLAAKFIEYSRITAGATTVTAAFSRVIAVLGGPVGVVISLLTTAGLAWLTWGNTVDDVTKKQNAFNDSIKRTRSELDKLDVSQLIGNQLEYTDAIEKSKVKVEGLEKKLKNLSSTNKSYLDPGGRASLNEVIKETAEAIAIEKQLILDTQAALKENNIVLQTRADLALKNRLDNEAALKAAEGIIKARKTELEKLREIEKINTKMQLDSQSTDRVITDQGLQADDETLTEDVRLAAMQAAADAEIKLAYDTASKRKAILDEQDMDDEIRREQKLQLDLDAAHKSLVVERKVAEDKKRFEEANQQRRLSQASGFFGNLAALSGSGNKKLARIGKAAAIAQATIDGFAAVQKALASAPPPFNFILAAGVGVATGANIAQIKATPLAKGGILDSGAQFVGTVNGNPAIAGESGVEAVVPLGRDSQGRLGIRGGGGVNVEGGVNVTINGNASAADVEDGVYAAMERIAQQEIADAKRPGNISNPTTISEVF